MGRKRKSRRSVHPGSPEEAFLLAVASDLAARGMRSHAAGILDALSMSQVEIARALGVSQSTVSALLAGLDRSLSERGSKDAADIYR